MIKVGDKVKIVDRCNIGSYVDVGTVGTVTVIDKADTRCTYKVSAVSNMEDKRVINVWYPATSIEEIKAEPAIKVGDKVAVVGRASYTPRRFDNETVTVMRIDEADAKATYDCHTSSGRYWFPATSVQAIAQSTNEQGESKMENNWIENTTGVCPFTNAPDTLLDVKYRDGEIKTGVKALASFRGRDTTRAFWDLDNSPADIVAYRLHADSEGWITVPKFNREMLVPHGTEVQVLKRNGNFKVGVAGVTIGFTGIMWRDDGESCDIVKYRLVHQPVVQAEVAPVEKTLAQKVADVELLNEQLREHVARLESDNAQLKAEIQRQQERVASVQRAVAGV